MEVQYGPKYKIYRKRKSWMDAKSYCKGEGGQLASVNTETDQLKLANLARGVRYVWLGGSNHNQYGFWAWADGSYVGYTQWRKDFGSKGGIYNCLILYKGEWMDYDCTFPYYFVCQFDLKSSKLSKSVTLEYTKQNCSHPNNIKMLVLGFRKL